jgi:transglutaminase-like putative cysteine protease
VATATLTRPEQTPVERYFDLALYLLIVTGFLCLAGTGKVDLLSLLVAGAAFGYRGYLLAKREVLTLSELWTTGFTIFYFVFYVADFFFLSRSFSIASVHLVLFALAVKVFSIHRERDLTWLAALALGQVLLAATLTVDTLFLLIFAAFLLVAVATAIAFEMRRTARRSLEVARAHGELHRLPSALSWTAVLLVGAILAAGTVIFFVLPRISANYLAALAPRSSVATGFSPDEVDLGQIGQIQQSSEIVMHVRVEGDAKGLYPNLHWRGVAFSTFDGKKWSNPPSRSTVLRPRDGIIALREATTRETPLPQDWKPIRYRVMMEPIGTNVFFLAGQPLALAGNYRMIAYDDALAFYDLDREHPLNAYQALASISEPVLSTGGGATPPAVSIAYLQTPSVDRRVRELAARVTAEGATDYQKARLLEEYLSTKLGYTLELPQQTPADPIANFLFERKRGHCEYFASSMAIMLRTLNIPARVVNGFRGGEFNEVTGSYIVRARDAHSWVEAYFPGTGWVRFDPTPAAAAEAPGGLRRFYYYLDALREFWREWVINYDFSHQTQVSNSVVLSVRRLMNRWRFSIRTGYQKLLQKARNMQEDAARSPQRWGGTAVLAVLVLLLALNARRILAAVRAARVARAPGSEPKKAASIWYERMARSVAKRGYEKTPAQTPHEFVITIEDPHLRRRVEAFTRAYERARFADSPDDARQLPNLYEEVARKQER